LLNAIGAMYGQALLNVIAGALIFYAAGLDRDHGRDVPGAMYFVGYLSLVIAVVLVACAILVTRGRAWARYPVAVIEALNLIGGLITVVSAGDTAFGPGIANIALSVLVLVGLFSRASTLWFRARAGQAAGGSA
jgi:hypothetical protein